MTTILIGISVGLGALVVLLLALLVVRWRSDNSADERVAEVVASLNARMDELGRELAGALERAEEEGRRSRIFGELAGSIGRACTSARRGISCPFWRRTWNGPACGR